MKKIYKSNKGATYLSEGARTENSIRNAMFGLVLQLVNSLINFGVRIIFVRVLGRDVNGLNSLFTEVIAIMALAEMGVGNSVVYNLYKPLADNDKQKLTELMTFFRKAYRLIAFFVFVIGMCIMPFLGYIVKGITINVSNVSPMNYVRFIFFLFVFQSAVSYLFSYKAALLNADQKSYIVSLVTGIIKIVVAAGNVIGILLTKDYVTFMLIQIAGTIATNVIISLKADKRYPYLKNSAPLPPDERKSVFSNIKNIFIGQVSGKITNSTDNILISMLVDTASCGVYANYAMIMNSVRNLFVGVSEGITGSIGNLMVTSDAENIHRVHKRMTFIYFVLGAVSAVGFFCAADPFVRLAFGKGYMLSWEVVLVCAFNFFFAIAKEPLWKLLITSGLFAKDRNISLLGSAINLVVSVAIGWPFGMFGIFLGTLITYIIQVILKIILLYRGRIHISEKKMLMYWLKMFIILCADLAAAKAICLLIGISNSVAAFFVNGIIAVVITLGSIVGIYCKTDEFDYFIMLIRRTIKNLLKKVRKNDV